ncbi:glycosyl hydrolase family 95 catalytic domain-containing protein [Chryseobacterium echinoideorum]|uniref:glycosyl hydrolase family 95 catalytic domain-containing protein n=1 Tax=Chryseobacterium echinoideorum TaxID=1549648 RepID=UPI001186EAC8|nr:glycoside hydrolase family 65 protein [Chryseobacterium echinoideorum]
MNKRFGITLFLVLFLTVNSFAQSQKSLWTIEAKNPDNYVGAPIASGKIGIVPWKEPFSVQHVMLNHVFDIGDAGVNQALQGINPFHLELFLDKQKVEMSSIKQWKHSLDLKKATHTTSFIIPGKAEVRYTITALRNLPYSGLIEVEIKALDQIQMQCFNQMDIPNSYIDVNKRLIEANVGLDGGKEMILQAEAQSAQKAHKVVASSEFLFDHKKLTFRNEDQVKNSIEGNLKKGETVKFSLVGSICTSRDFNDPKSESEREVIYVSYLGTDRILKEHYALWEELWKGDIEIEGDDEAQLVARSALFNLYSNALENSRLSISPMGLSGTFYSGHIFWDSEIWMYPPMLFMNQGIAKSMVDYRTDRLKAGENRAMSYGYKGAMYPWESDDKGEEATPINALTGQFEHHITADIGIAFWNYYLMTQDKDWLTKEAYPVMQKIAEFWTSRASRNEDGSYSIKYVIGADEYAEGVDDNAYTNAAAKKALEYAANAAVIVGKTAPKIWKDISDHLVITKMSNGVTQEYKGYKGEMIKQADVNLLAYPLGIITDANQIKKDLEYYSAKVDKDHGPAMTFSAFSVQYARLGDADKAYAMFKKAYQPNQRPPFGVLAETPSSSNPYFMTGAGGILQAFINGFGGLDITEIGIIQHKTVLPKHWRKLTIKGVGPERKDFTVSQ